MKPIQVRFDHKVGPRGAFLSGLTFMVSDDHKDVWASTAHWPYKTKDGYADLRYKPITKSWPLKQLCASLGSIQTLGDFQYWDQPRTPSPFKNALVEQSVKRGGCTIRWGSLYWDDWEYVSLYKRGEFVGFNAAVDVLRGLWDEVRGPNE